MYIEELRISSYRHLRDIKFGPFRAPVNPSELIVLAGPNGGGKTSVLELLSRALTTSYGWQFWNSRGSATEAYALKIGLNDREIAELISRDATQRLQSDQQGHDRLAQYLRRARGFWVEQNVSAVPPEDANDNRRARELSNSIYGNHQRKLGFFIRSERAFRSRGYAYQNLINRARRFSLSHFNEISWHSTDNQYNEIYDFIIEQSWDYTYQLGLYHKAMINQAPIQLPTDPLIEYNKLLDRIFPGYKFVDVEENNLTLRVKLPTGNVIGFDEMSSGEKETFFILALFIRHSINDSIIVIDEPELHLHPELARKLLRIMRVIQPQNQIWCATHSAEIIDETGRERAYFLRSSADRTRTECTPATNENAELSILRDMYGYSGYVGISKKIVFTEGIDSSADRKTFTNLLPNLTDEVKIIPAGSNQELYRINNAVLSLLESSFARCEFFLIRDHDFLSDAAVEKHRAIAPGRLFVLSRYHIENYLLDEDCISAVLRSLYQIDLSPDHALEELRQIAVSMSASVLRDLAVSRLNELYQAEDCGVRNHSQSLSVVNAQGADQAVLVPLREAILRRVAEVNSAISSRTEAAQAEAIFDGCQNIVINALGSGDWKSLFPGRRLLTTFSKRRGLGEWPILQNLIIADMSKRPERVPSELRDIFNAISPRT